MFIIKYSKHKNICTLNKWLSRRHSDIQTVNNRMCSENPAKKRERERTVQRINKCERKHKQNDGYRIESCKHYAHNLFYSNDEYFFFFFVLVFAELSCQREFQQHVLFF